MRTAKNRTSISPRENCTSSFVVRSKQSQLEITRRLLYRPGEKIVRDNISRGEMFLLGVSRRASSALCRFPFFCSFWRFYFRARPFRTGRKKNSVERNGEISGQLNITEIHSGQPGLKATLFIHISLGGLRRLLIYLIANLIP